jgi:NAD(P)-dependent dehydrogenase (short-subunit alcohol dehydrogenase family)
VTTSIEEKTMPVAVITGASRGLGRALAIELARRQWRLVLDARGADELGAVQAGLAGGPHHALAGDVADAAHRANLAAAARSLGGASLLVNNASTLGASPLPAFADLDPATYLRILKVNLVAPMALTAALLPQLRGSRGRVLNVSSDAAVAAYETWGGYGSSKAALDHASRVLAAEEPEIRVYSLDPGDMRTRMHQDAFPGEDISDRPAPEAVVPAVLALLAGDRPSGRYVAGELISEAA